MDHSGRVEGPPFNHHDCINEAMQTSVMFLLPVVLFSDRKGLMKDTDKGHFEYRTIVVERKLWTRNVRVVGRRGQRKEHLGAIHDTVIDLFLTEPTVV